MILTLTILVTLGVLALLVGFGARARPRWAPLAGFAVGLGLGGGFILLGGLVRGGLPLLVAVAGVAGLVAGGVATRFGGEEAGRWVALYTWLGGVAALGLLLAALLVDCSFGDCPLS